MDKQDGYNFELMKNPQNDANHLFLVQADVQVTSGQRRCESLWQIPAGYKKNMYSLIREKETYSVLIVETSWVIPPLCIHLTLIPYLLWTFPFIVLSATMT